MGSLSDDAVTALQQWERFHSGRCTDAEIASSLRLQRWSRSRAAGLSADDPAAPVMDLERLERSRDAFAPLLAPGAPFDAFANAMAKYGFCGIFCDDAGVILSRHISEPFESTVARTRLVEGAVWSESARGTNGVGTTLVEGGPVEVLGAEHYEQRNHGLACYGAPIRDVRARVVAVLDASGPAAAGAPFVHASVLATAAAIEALIVARTYDAAMPGGMFEIERLLANLPHGGLVVESTGHIRRANSRFRAMSLADGERALAKAVREKLAADPRWIAGRLEDLPAALRGMQVEVEPIGLHGDPFAALVHIQPRARRHPAAAAAPLPPPFESIVGNDAAIAAAREQAVTFARSDLPVLLLAETGAGKELFARAIHGASARRSHPFVAINCGGLVGSLLESEMFGYAAGAFTGANPSGRDGKLAAAHGGTLFLDEIGELSLPAQAALLRFLEDGSFSRIGEVAVRSADVRLIAATHRDLPALVSEGRFRADLYYRLRGVTLRLPPLRARTDRAELAAFLLSRAAEAAARPKPLGLSRAALAWIEQHDWPGNVRELRSALAYAVVLAGEAPRIELWHLPIEASESAEAPGELRSSAERSALLQALAQSKGNLSTASRSLGVARSTLYRMLARHGMKRPPAADRGAGVSDA